MLYTGPNGIDKKKFLTSNYANIKPKVSAEWNNNLILAPYVVVSGDGAFDSNNIAWVSGETLTTPATELKEGFTTSSFPLNPGGSNITFSFIKAAFDAGEAYKVIFYAKTDYNNPSIVNVDVSNFGSQSKEIDSFQWTKFEVYCGWGSNDVPSELDIFINVFKINDDQQSGNSVYITTPEVYKITRFDFEQGALWSAYSPFQYFRPGESYVTTGNANIPNNVYDNRKITNPANINDPDKQTMPMNPIVYQPNFLLASAPVFSYKNALPNSEYSYQYFMSSNIDAEKIITAKYEKPVQTNKLVLKFNVIEAIPTVQITINGVLQTFDYIPDSSGLLTLYYDNGSWSIFPWTTMPTITDSGEVSMPVALISSLSVTQISSSINSSFSSFSSIATELTRMQLIEFSPRLELDLSRFVMTVDINKSLDNANTYIPISSVNANDASVVFSSIPFYTANGPVTFLSGQDNNSNSIFKNMLRKNVKIYINFEILEMDIANTITSYSPYEYVPGGIFYVDTWSEGSDSVTAQAYDITRYLQTTPSPDYVANMQDVFTIISNILDLSGFTDYNYDSLREVCKSYNSSIDLAYFFCNSKDSTLLDTLSQLFLAYQIGAYIDEYGIMNFLSLEKLIPDSSREINLFDSNVVKDGYSIETATKPGKISVRYQPPKIKQSLALQNVKDIGVLESSSFIYTTSNDVVWSQQNTDSVGFNYLNADMLKTDNKFNLNVNDVLDIFHTYSLNSGGYALIEDEIVSFDYKEYSLSAPSITPVIKSVKNDIELSSEINNFIKTNKIGLTANNDSTVKVESNVTVSQTGNITNTKRGLFGTKINDHKLLTTSLADKNLSSYAPGTTFAYPINNKIAMSGQVTDFYSNPIDGRLLVYPTTDVDYGNVYDSISGKYIGYQTYVTKFEFADIQAGSTGLFFNMISPTNQLGAYFVEIVKYIDSSPDQNIRYECIISVQTSTRLEILAKSDITALVSKIIYNFPKALIADPNKANNYLQNMSITSPLILKVVHYPESSDLGNATFDGDRLIKVFLNNNEIKTWEVPSASYTSGFGLSTITNAIVNTGPLVLSDTITSLEVNPSSATITNAFAVQYSTGITYTTSVAHSFMVGDTVTITGISPTEYNVTGIIDYIDTNLFHINNFYNSYNTTYSSGGSAAVNRETNIPSISITTTDNKMVYGDSVTLSGVTPSDFNNPALTGPLTVAYADSTSLFFYIDNTLASTLPASGSGGTASTTRSTLDYITYTADNSFLIGDFVTISGVTPSEYNIFGFVADATPTEFSIAISPGTYGMYSSGGLAERSIDSNIIGDFLPIAKNEVNGLNKVLILPAQVAESTKYGVFSSANPTIPNYGFGLTGETVSYVSEIYACQTPLKDSFSNYYHQDKSFLNSVLQNKNIIEKTFCAQTKPEVIGINSYNVEYTTPAAISVDVLPVEYLWHYFPGVDIKDQKWMQTQFVPDTSLSYSTPINTGFKSKMMIVNNSPHMVFLNKDSDSLNQFTVKLNLWTHEIITSSDQEIIEKTIDQSNALEVAQIDSNWIQSKQTASRLMSLIGANIDGFSKTTTLNIFGNPLIQVGDTIVLTYPLAGINQNKYLVHSVSQSFNNGLSTKLTLKTIGDGVPFTNPITKYTITYHSNDATSGIVPVDNNTYFEQQTVTIQNTNLQKSGFAFNGWNDVSDGSGTSYTPLDQTRISTNIDLYAQWV